MNDAGCDIFGALRAPRYIDNIEIPSQPKNYHQLKVANIHLSPKAM